MGENSPDREQSLMTATHTIIVPSQQTQRRASLVRRDQPPPRRPRRRSAIWQIPLLLAVLGTLMAGFWHNGPLGGTPFAALGQAFTANAAAVKIPPKIVTLVPTFTQVDASIGYLSSDQYSNYWGAACSAAASGEVLTAWGDPHARIGQLIVDFGPYLSPNDGLLDFAGFNRVAQIHHANAKIWHGMTNEALIHIVNDLGYPVIIGVRANANSYYGYLAGGHFLVVTGADANGFKIVDSSMYYIHYLNTATFESLWNADGRRAVLLTPADLQVNI